MAETCGKDEPLPQSEIMPEDIDAQMNELSWQEKEKSESRSGNEKGLTAMSKILPLCPSIIILEQRGGDKLGNRYIPA